MKIERIQWFFFPVRFLFPTFLFSLWSERIDEKSIYRNLIVTSKCSCFKLPLHNVRVSCLEFNLRLYGVLPGCDVTEWNTSFVECKRGFRWSSTSQVIVFLIVVVANENHGKLRFPVWCIWKEKKLNKRFRTKDVWNKNI